MITNIYQKALETMPPEHIDHWCSDLYLKVTPESKKIVADYQYKKQVTQFIDAIDGVYWYCIPFAYYGTGWRG